MGELATAARGAGPGGSTAPARLEEDVFTLAVATPPSERRLSVAGCRILARQFRTRVEAHHALAVARVGRARRARSICTHCCRCRTTFSPRRDRSSDAGLDDRPLGYHRSAAPGQRATPRHRPSPAARSPRRRLGFFTAGRRRMRRSPRWRRAGRGCTSCCGRCRPTEAARHARQRPGGFRHADRRHKAAE